MTNQNETIKLSHLEKTGNFAKLIGEIAPSLISLSLCLGFIYLFLYISQQKIPFPLSLSSLPSLLLITFSITLVAILIIIAFIFLPLLANYSQSNIKDIFPTEKIKDKNNFKEYLHISGNSLILCFIIIGIIPLFHGKVQFHYILWPAYLLSVAKIIHYTIKNHATDQSRSDLLFGVLYINWINLIWILIFTVALFNILSNPTLGKLPKFTFWIVYPILSVSLIIFNYIQILPNRIIAKYLSDKRTLIMLSVIILFTPIFIAPLGGHIVKKSLHLLRLGGFYKTVLYLKKGSKEFLPKDLLVTDITTSNNLTFTKELSVILSVGDYIYFTYGTNDKTFAIEQKQVIYAEYPK